MGAGAKPGPDRIEAAQNIIGHTFADPSLLDAALTHPSYAEESSGATGYERLEFLGDAVLGLVVVEECYRRFPDLAEGIMTKIKIAVVSGTVLTATAEELGLAPLLLLGEGERRNASRGRRSALENAFEAVCGAIYLDGGYEAARGFILRTLGSRIVPEIAAFEEHPKSALLEYVQARSRNAVFSIESSEGPPHDRTFNATVTIDGALMGRGSGRSKKEAESNAAAEALLRLEDADDQAS